MTILKSVRYYSYVFNCKIFRKLFVNKYKSKYQLFIFKRRR